MLLSEMVGELPGKLVRDGEFSSIAFATEGEEKNFLTFLEREKYAPALDNPNISCVFVTEELLGFVPDHIAGVFVCEDPKAEMFALHNMLASNEEYVGETFDTRIGEGCSISPLSYIDAKNVIIGDDVVIEPFVVIKGRVTVGDHTVIRAGSVIGCKGFSFAHDSRGGLIPNIDTARIVIGENVELFEKVTVTTGLFPWEVTYIGDNTKIDVLGFVAHGSHIGKNCLLAGGCKVCGNCRIGNDAWIGPGAVVSNRISVGDGGRVSIGAVVTKDVGAGETVSGNFAIEHRLFLSNLKASLQAGAQEPQKNGEG